MIQSRHLPSASVARLTKACRLSFSKSSLSPLSGRLSKVPVRYLIPLIFPFLTLSYHIPVSCLPQPRGLNCGPDFRQSYHALFLPPVTAVLR